MKGFVHIRIDDRLIHGQVATRWSTGLKVNRIMVIDDAVAANDNEKAILRMAAPAGVNTSILPLEKAVANIKNGNYDGQRVMLIEIQGTLACQGKEAVWQGYAKLYPGKKTPKEERQEERRQAEAKGAATASAEENTALQPESAETVSKESDCAAAECSDAASGREIPAEKSGETRSK